MRRVVSTLVYSLLFTALATAAHEPRRAAWTETWGSGAFGEIRDLAVDRDRAYVGAASGSFDVRAVELVSGLPIWRSPFEDAGAAAAIAASRDRVFAAGSIVGTTGDADWIVAAFDAANGALRWQDVFDHRQLGDSVSDLALADGRLFAAGRVTSHLRFGGEYLVRAYDAVTGTLLWEDQRSTGGDDSADHVIAEGDRVWVAGALAPSTLPKVFVRAYDAATGDVLWSRRVDSASDARPSGIGKLGNRILVSSEQDGHWAVRVYAAETGRLLWRHDDASGVQPTNVIGARGRFVVGGAGAGPDGFDMLTRAYDARTGKVLWEDRLSALSQSTYARALNRKGNTIVVAGTSYGSPPEGHAIRVRALDLRTGRVQWEFEHGAPSGDEEATVVDLHRRWLLVGGLTRPIDSGARALLVGYKAAPAD